MKKIIALSIFILFCITTQAQDKIQQSIYFETDGFTFDAQAQKQMLSLKNRLIRNPYHRIEIYGNTDSVGDIKYNQELSKKRVNSVVAYFLNGCTKTKRIKKTGAFGEKSPIADNGSEYGRRKNRRVDIIIQLDKDLCIKDGCAKTCIPKGTFDPHFTNEVKIALTPITTFDQMAENNISPQTNRGDYLFSNGMMRITSTVNGKPVSPKKNVKISIPAHRIDPDMAIYEGSSGKGAVKWERKTIELKKTSGDCLVYEIDGSWLNKWVNMDKPRPANNRICLDNPFIYLEMPMDEDTSKVIESDIILSFASTSFKGYNMRDVEVETGNVVNMCDWLKNNITSNTTDGQLLVKKQRVLKLNGFTAAGKKIESPDLEKFTAYFPFKGKGKAPTFFVSEKDADGNIIWNNAGQPDSIKDLKGCGCKYYVKEFNYPVQYINISTTEEKEAKEEEVETQKLRFKKVKVSELFVFYKKDNMMVTLKPDENGHFDIPLYNKQNQISVIGKYFKDGEVHYFDARLSKLKPAWFGWFSKTKRVKKKNFRVYTEKKGLKLKTISCRKGKSRAQIKKEKREKKEDILWLNNSDKKTPPLQVKNKYR